MTKTCPEQSRRVNPSEITPEHVYLSRRKFMVGIGALVTSSLVSRRRLRRRSDPDKHPPSVPLTKSGRFCLSLSKSRHLGDSSGKRRRALRGRSQHG
jgi:hypothetical protein